MTFLKKLGVALAKGLQIAAAVGGVALPFLSSNPKIAGVATVVESDLVQVGQIVTTTEAIIRTPGSGAMKLEAATPLVSSFVKASELVAGKKIVNEALFIQGCAKITGGTADILNSLDPNAAQTVSNS